MSMSAAVQPPSPAPSRGDRHATRFAALAAFLSTGLWLVTSCIFTTIGLGLIIAVYWFNKLSFLLFDTAGFTSRIARAPRSVTAAALAGLLLLCTAEGQVVFGVTDQGAALYGACFVFLLALFSRGGALITAYPRDFGMLRDEIKRRWPEKWIARHLREPLDAIWFRTMAKGTLMMIPTTIALFVPGMFGIPLLAIYLVAWCANFMDHEDMYHTHVHRSIVTPNRTATRGPRLLLGALRLYLDYVLAPICGRVPHFYRIQHAVIHHVENNGPCDTQTTMWLDRTSYIDFCNQGLRMAASYAFAIDVMSYLAKRGRQRQIRYLAGGLAGYYAALGLLAVLSWQAGLAYFSIVLLFGVVVATITIYWHGLIDPYRPHEVFANTANDLVSNEHGALGVAFHIEHHLRPGDHWSALYGRAAGLHARHESQRSVWLNFRSGGEYQLLRALWTRRFDDVASLCQLAGQDGLDADVASAIAGRTRPLTRDVRHGCAAAVDHGLGRMAALMMPRVTAQADALLEYPWAA